MATGLLNKTTVFENEIRRREYRNLPEVNEPSPGIKGYMSSMGIALLVMGVLGVLADFVW